MAEFTGVITQLSEIYSLPHGHPFCAYRGHRNALWTLTPSLFRSLPRFQRDTADHFEAIEERFIAQFFDRCRPFLSSIFDGTNFWDRIIAQHYGLPTRLLDVTSDPHVALYFAVTGPEQNLDSAVFCIKLENGVETFYNTKRSPHAQNPDLMLGDREMILVTPPIIDQRITSQKAKFILSKTKLNKGNFVPLEERSGISKLLQKFRIPQESKKRLKRELIAIGVDESSLFPGIASVASVLRDEMFETA